MSKFAGKLKCLKATLKEWSKQEYGNFSQAVHVADAVLERELYYEKDASPSNRQEDEKAQAELMQKLKIDEDFWRQKSNIRC